MKLCCCFFLVLFAVGGFGFAEEAGEWVTMLEGFQIIDFAIDDDTIWCATISSGLICYNTLDGSIRQYNIKDGPYNNPADSVAIDKHGLKWFGFGHSIATF